MTKFWQTLRLLGLLYVGFEYLVPDAGLVQSWGYAAKAAQVPTLNPTTLQIPATGVDFNNLIRQINGILAGTLPATGNNIILGNSASGQIATISTGGPGADANASLGLNPAGTGNIILFPLAPTTDTGVLQFGNPFSFQATNGLAACPGSAPNMMPRLGLSATVTGYIVVKDWLGNSHGLPAC